MAFKYQALNDSHSSLASLSSQGSSRSIDSGRQQPRLEFSAAGTTTSRSSAGLSEERPCSFSRAVGAEGVMNCEPRLDRGHHCINGKCVEENVAGERNGVLGRRPSACEDGGCTSNATTVLQQKSTSGLNETATESETGLYIHSSVRSGGSGIRFSRQVADRHAVPQTREHGKLFKALQKFSNKRAQQRFELESEKRSRKSPQHGRAETGREKENFGSWKRSHKNKQGKKGHFPVSRSSNSLSGFSDVACGRTDVDSSREGLLGHIEAGEGLSNSALSHVDHNRYHECRGSHHSECDRSLNRYRVSVHRSNSLKESVHYSCDVNKVDTRTVSKSAASSITNLTRGGVSTDSSREKKAHVLFHQSESRDSPDTSDSN